MTIPSTIRKGASGNDVKKWQKILGLPEDGSFSAAVEEATKVWQSKHKLNPDGVVGPITWGLALGVPAVSGPTASQKADAEAYRIAKNAAPTMPEKQLQYTLAVGRGEGQFGAGWAYPSKKTIEDSQKYGLTGYEGKGSNNWGAVQGKGSAGAFRHVDYHADGTLYVNDYKRYATPEEGFLDMARIILNGGKRGKVGADEIKAAIEKGSLRDAVFAQHKNGYFELNPEKYLQAVMRNYQVMSVNVPDWKKVLSEHGGDILKGVLVGIGALLLAGGSIAALMFRRG